MDVLVYLNQLLKKVKIHFVMAMKLTLFLFVSSIIFSQNANAISPYDANYLTTDDLIISQSYNSGCMPGVDITESWTSYITDESKWRNTYQETMPDVKASFLKALRDGRWGVSQTYSFVGTGSEYQTVLIYWSEDNDLALDWTSTQWHVMADNVDGVVELVCAGNNTATQMFPSLGNYDNVTVSANLPAPTFNGGVKNMFIYTDHPNSPENYEGVGLVGKVSASDTLDTDKDGLTDYVESPWYPFRDDVFCNKGTTPYTCAYPNPYEKDLYVEIDWMKDSSHDFKPTSSQLNPIITAFADKNINLHFDTGQYGGGTEILYEESIHFDSTQGENDFYDYVEGTESHSRTLAMNRYGIWRYMMMGDHYKDILNPNSSGIAVIGGSSAFIAYQAIADSNHADHDRAISGTIMHELGHNLCLSKTTVYANDGQDSSCVFSGVDEFAGISYPSVMNYSYQDKQGLLNYMQDVDYSSGSDSMGNHDDWAAILTGIDDFKRGFTASGKNMLAQANYYSVEKQRPTSPNMSSALKKDGEGVSLDENAKILQYEDTEKSVASGVNKSNDKSKKINHLYVLLIVVTSVTIASGLTWWILRRRR